MVSRNNMCLVERMMGENIKGGGREGKGGREGVMGSWHHSLLPPTFS